MITSKLTKQHIIPDKTPEFSRRVHIVPLLEDKFKLPPLGRLIGSVLINLLWICVMGDKVTTFE
jgi:hypothetical protein